LTEDLRLACALALLACALGSAVARPRWGPEWLVAAAGAGLLLAIGAISPSRAGKALSAIGPTVGFLAALLMIAEGCRREGVFKAIGALLAGAAASPPRRLLALVFAVATLVTVVLGLDATVVLLTPVVLVAVAWPGRDGPTAGQAAPGRAALYACAHLANSGSLLLPVSNLTNLLAFHASHVSFLHFAALMALPSIAVLAIEWLAFQRFFARELRASPPGETPSSPAEAPSSPAETPSSPGETPSPPRSERGSPELPRYPLAIVALTLAGFALSSLGGVDPVWVAAAGAVAITVPALATGRAQLLALTRALEPGFLLFVLALALIVRAAALNGLGSAVRTLLPSGAGLPELLAIAALAAALANVLNNLPATLLLTALIGGGAGGAGRLLAMLIGVNVGPNLAPPGSLATLLWRRVLGGAGVNAPTREFVRLGLLSVPVALVVCTALLWVALRA
jgi:arsenical pump membrane protein